MFQAFFSICMILLHILSIVIQDAFMFYLLIIKRVSTGLFVS